MKKDYLGPKVVVNIQGPLYVCKKCAWAGHDADMESFYNSNEELYRQHYYCPVRKFNAFEPCLHRVVKRVCVICEQKIETKQEN